MKLPSIHLNVLKNRGPDSSVMDQYDTVTVVHRSNHIAGIIVSMVGVGLGGLGVTCSP